MFFLRDCHHPSSAIKHDEPGAGGALINGANVARQGYSSSMGFPSRFPSTKAGFPAGAGVPAGPAMPDTKHRTVNHLAYNACVRAVRILDAPREFGHCRIPPTSTNGLCQATRKPSLGHLTIQSDSLRWRKAPWTEQPKNLGQGQGTESLGPDPERRICSLGGSAQVNEGATP
jgi:hypothetical protein